MICEVIGFIGQMVVKLINEQRNKRREDCAGGGDGVGRTAESHGQLQRHSHEAADGLCAD